MEPARSHPRNVPPIEPRLGTATPTTATAIQAPATDGPAQDLGTRDRPRGPEEGRSGDPPSRTTSDREKPSEATTSPTADAPFPGSDPDGGGGVRARAEGVPVLFIGGSQRSGSTLLDRIVSQLPGYVSAGEVVHIWERGLRDHELCGCGERFDGCPFWLEVGERAFGGWDRVDVDTIVGLKGSVDRNRYIFFMLLPWSSPRYRRNLERYAELMSRLYRAIGEVGGGVVVDSSKHASTAFLLRRVPSLRPQVVHLVRDSRGVAFSLSKRVRRPEAVGREDFMHRRSPRQAALEWLAFNLAFHLLKAVGTPTRRIRYEDLVRDPGITLRRCVGPAAAGAAPDFISDRRVTLGVDHTVAGNPMRFRHGDVELRADDVWREELNDRDRRTITRITWPLLRRYGYLEGP